MRMTNAAIKDGLAGPLSAQRVACDHGYGAVAPAVRSEPSTALRQSVRSRCDNRFQQITCEPEVREHLSSPRCPDEVRRMSLVEASVSSPAMIRPSSAPSPIGHLVVQQRGLERSPGRCRMSHQQHCFSSRPAETDRHHIAEVVPSIPSGWSYCRPPTVRAGPGVLSDTVASMTPADPRFRPRREPEPRADRGRALDATSPPINSASRRTNGQSKAGASLPHRRRIDLRERREQIFSRSGAIPIPVSRTSQAGCEYRADPFRAL